MKTPVCEEEAVVANAARERCDRDPGHKDAHHATFHYRGGAVRFSIEVYW